MTLRRCLPCEKELLNSMTATKLANQHKIAERLPGLVVTNRMKGSAADALFERMIVAEKAFCAECDAIAEDYLAAVEPPYPVEA